MKLYFTPNLRPNDAGIFITGQNYLNIPSGLESHQEEGECPADCTNQLFTGNLHVFSALNHMHYLGKLNYSRKINVAFRLTEYNQRGYTSD